MEMTFPDDEEHGPSHAAPRARVDVDQLSIEEMRLRLSNNPMWHRLMALYEQNLKESWRTIPSANQHSLTPEAVQRMLLARGINIHAVRPSDVERTLAAAVRRYEADIRATDQLEAAKVQETREALARQAEYRAVPQAEVDAAEATVRSIFLEKRKHLTESLLASISIANYDTRNPASSAPTAAAAPAGTDYEAVLNAALQGEGTYVELLKRRRDAASAAAHSLGR